MERALVKRHFVVVAKFLLKLNNFNSFVGICVGLNNASVIRLKKTEALFQKNYASESEVITKIRTKEPKKKRNRKIEVQILIPFHFLSLYFMIVIFLDVRKFIESPRSYRKL